MGLPVPPAPPKIVGFNDWDAKNFHKQRRQLGHKASLGAAPLSAVGVFPCPRCPFPNTQGLGRFLQGVGSGAATLPQTCSRPRPPRDLSASFPPQHTPGEHGALLEGCATRIITDDWAYGHFAVLGLRGRRCLSRPELEGFRPDAVDAPWLPQSTLYPQRPSKAPITNTMVGPHPTLTHFLSQSVCARRLTTAG